MGKVKDAPNHPIMVTIGNWPVLESLSELHIMNPDIRTIFDLRLNDSQMLALVSVAPNTKAGKYDIFVMVESNGWGCYGVEIFEIR